LADSQNIIPTERKGKRKATEFPVNKTVTPSGLQTTRSSLRKKASDKPHISKSQMSHTLHNNTRSRMRRTKTVAPRHNSNLGISLRSRSKRVRLTSSQGPKSSREHSAPKTSAQLQLQRPKLHTSNKLSMQSTEIIDLTIEYVNLYFYNLIKVF
jgi:hypothetical protein